MKITQKQILEMLERVKAEITGQLAPFAKHVPAHRDEHGYADAMIPYIHRVEELREEYDARFKAIAKHIGALHKNVPGGAGWQENTKICQLWLEFAHAAKLLQHNPKTEKGVAAVYVNDNNQLISYSASNFWLREMRPTHEYKAHWLTMESRRKVNICAEQAALIKRIGHEKLDTGAVIRKTKDVDGVAERKLVKITKLQKRMDIYRRRITAFSAASHVFKNSTLITTADPCGYCAPIVIAAGVTTLIGGHDKHAHGLSHDRRKDIAEATSIFQNLRRIEIHRLEA